MIRSLRYQEKQSLVNLVVLFALILAAYCGGVAFPSLASADVLLFPIPDGSIPEWIELPDLVDGRPTEPDVWYEVQVEELAAASDPWGRFGEWVWAVSDDGLRASAEQRAQRWFGFDDVNIGSSKLSAKLEYGGRLHLSTYTGYKSSSQKEVRADYELGSRITLRSIASERGESIITLRSGLGFW